MALREARAIGCGGAGFSVFAIAGRVSGGCCEVALSGGATDTKVTAAGAAAPFVLNPAQTYL